VTVIRSDLADADGVEVSTWLIEHGVGEVSTSVIGDAMHIASTTDSDAEIEAALEGFEPTAARGEYVYVPPELRPHKDHLKAYRDAERDGTMTSWTTAEFRQRTAHALADVIEYIRRDQQDA
jgi:hypothetical protein